MIAKCRCVWWKAAGNVLRCCVSSLSPWRRVRAPCLVGNPRLWPWKQDNPRTRMPLPPPPPPSPPLDPLRHPSPFFPPPGPSAPFPSGPAIESSRERGPKQRVNTPPAPRPPQLNGNPSLRIREKLETCCPGSNVVSWKEDALKGCVDQIWDMLFIGIVWRKYVYVQGCVCCRRLRAAATYPGGAIVLYYCVLLCSLAFRRGTAKVSLSFGSVFVCCCSFVGSHAAVRDQGLPLLSCCVLFVVCAGSHLELSLSASLLPRDVKLNCTCRLLSLFVVPCPLPSIVSKS